MSSLARRAVISWKSEAVYIKLQIDPRGLLEGSKEMEKRTVSLVHELLSLTLWKKLSIVKLGHFGREFRLPEKLNVLLLKHPGIFYVSNKYQIYTVLLREGYNGSELNDKDPLLVVKEKFGELMQEGLHEYNQRHLSMNLERKKKKGMILERSEKRKDPSTDMSEQDDPGSDVGGLFDPEERKRFYKVLFDDRCTLILNQGMILHNGHVVKIVVKSRIAISDAYIVRTFC
ncbi:hypothetical protein RHMOL_Rhmol13G0260300 [Rhododendron molle]|uniref:Uncharacterized protein n=1 Tax=Rhododendron molle TaxID=49168 RepID=A0ACC0LAS3_RHOML|nr:hypothetical protein RHMOL_Rhmol13G0260300 [Rhododendron molle]